jgi:hypothetical protein
MPYARNLENFETRGRHAVTRALLTLSPEEQSQKVRVRK